MSRVEGMSVLVAADEEDISGRVVEKTLEWLGHA